MAGWLNSQLDWFQMTSRLPACLPTDVAGSHHLVVAVAGHSEELRSLRHRPRNVVQNVF